MFCVWVDVIDYNVCYWFMFTNCHMSMHDESSIHTLCQSIICFSSHRRKKNNFRRESSRESCIGSDTRLLAKLLARLFGAKSLNKSLAESLAKSLVETLSETLGETFGKTISETLAETFRAEESRQESCQESRIGPYA